MVRITHVEADGVDVIADGHHVECRIPRADAEGRAAYSGENGVLAGVLDWLAGLVIVCFEAVGRLVRFVFAETLNLFLAILTGLLQGCVRTIGTLFAVVLLPLLHELLCIAGAAILCPVGALGRRLALASSQAGAVLRQRSVVLVASGRVLAAANSRFAHAGSQTIGRTSTPATAGETTDLADAVSTPRQLLSEARVAPRRHVVELREQVIIHTPRARTRGTALPPSLGRGKG